MRQMSGIVIQASQSAALGIAQGFAAGCIHELLLPIALGSLGVYDLTILRAYKWAAAMNSSPWNSIHLPLPALKLIISINHDLAPSREATLLHSETTFQRADSP